MKRKGDISTFFLKKQRSNAGQEQTNPSVNVSCDSYQQQVRAESVNSDCVILFLPVYCDFFKASLLCYVILHNLFSDKAEYEEVPSTNDDEDPETLLTQDANVSSAGQNRDCKLCP